MDKRTLCDTPLWVYPADHFQYYKANMSHVLFSGLSIYLWVTRSVVAH